MTQEQQIRFIPLETWYKLACEDAAPPVTIPLEGDSMRPLIRRGVDKVTIAPLTRALKVGDIVLFKAGPTRFVVHRVQALRDGMVRTLGDNCLYSDGWLPLENIWGLVVRMKRDGRTYALDTALSRVWGRLWMITLPMRRVYRHCRQLAARCYRKVFRNVIERR